MSPPTIHRISRGPTEGYDESDIPQPPARDVLRWLALEFAEKETRALQATRRFDREGMQKEADAASAEKSGWALARYEVEAALSALNRGTLAEGWEPGAHCERIECERNACAHAIGLIAEARAGDIGSAQLELKAKALERQASTETGEAAENLSRHAELLRQVAKELDEGTAT